MGVDWSPVRRADVVRALDEYDRLGAEQFFAAHGFAPTTTYDLVRDGRRYPPKAILGTAYELATGRRLASSDFEGGRAAPSASSLNSASPSAPGRLEGRPDRLAGRASGAEVTPPARSGHRPG